MTVFFIPLERTNSTPACSAEQVEQIPRLGVAEMVADMRPPTDDDVPIALDGTRLDTPETVIAYVDEINARGFVR